MGVLRNDWIKLSMYWTSDGYEAKDAGVHNNNLNQCQDGHRLVAILDKQRELNLDLS